MVKVTLGNSYSKVTGLTVGQFKALRSLLSYKVDAGVAFYQGGHRPQTKYMIDARGNFPTGLWTKVKAHLGAGVEVTDTRVRPLSRIESLCSHGALFTREPYPAQSAARAAAWTKHRGTISMPTGTGKSEVIAQITHAFSVKTLIIVPSIEIKRQLLETFQGIFADLTNIRIENIDSAALPRLTGFDCLIIDEAHHVAAKTYQRLNRTAWKDIYYRFFLTATPFRNNTEENLLFEGIAGQVIYKLSYTEAVKKKYIVPVEAYYLEVPKQETDAYTWAQVYSQLVVKNEHRNVLIGALLARLGTTPVLCLVKEIAHGNALVDLTGTPFANGQDVESRLHIADFNRGGIKGLIGTQGILGEGVDTKPAEYVIIAGLGKAKSAFMQAVGRGVRNYPGKESAKIIIFKDNSHKFTKSHFAAQCKILKEEYGVVPQKLEL